LKPSSRAIISRTNLPQQFDEYVWFDETRAVTPRDTAEIKGLPGARSRRVKRDVDPRSDLHIESSWVYELEARDKCARRAAKS
jgi:hypothetical protein